MLDPFIPEIAGMSKYIHKVLARKLFILLAIALEVDEMTFTNMHTYESKCEAFLRYMQYLPRSQQEDEDLKDLYLPGHADWGSKCFPVSIYAVMNQANTNPKVSHSSSINLSLPYKLEIQMTIGSGSNTFLIILSLMLVKD